MPLLLNRPFKFSFVDSLAYMLQNVQNKSYKMNSIEISQAGYTTGNSTSGKNWLLPDISIIDNVEIYIHICMYT